MYHFYHQQPNPTFRLFSGVPGVDNLETSLTINGVTVTPSFRYTAIDANGTDWGPWTYGTTLTLQAGTVPTYNQGSPLSGANDDSVKLNNGGYYQASVSSTGDIATEDVVFEIVFKYSGTASVESVITHGDATPPGWLVYVDAFDRIIFRFSDSSPAAVNHESSVSSLVDGTWNHCMCFGDRSGSAQWYVNGVASGAPDSIAALGSLTSGDSLTVGARNDGSVPSNQQIAYIAMWKYDNWLDTHLQADVALERFNQLIGIAPSRAAGTSVPTIQTRATEAHIDKIESGARYIYNVGSGWLRLVSRNDSNGINIKGYLSELSCENLCLQSEDLSTTWAVIDADSGDTIGGSVTTPNKSTSTSSGIIGDTENETHGVSQQITLTATDYTFSVFAQKGDQDWLYLANQTVPTADGYFDLNNGVLGTIGGAATGYIEDWGGGWYRCAIAFTGTAADHTFVIAPAAADTDTTFAGNGSDVNTYVWGVQVEAAEYMSSYVPTTTTSETRDPDILQFKGDDGNLGGVGSELQGSVSSKILLEDYDAVTAGYIFSLSDGGSSADRIVQYVATTDVIASYTASSGGNTGSVAGATDVFDGQIHRARITWEDNSLNNYVDDTVDGAEDTTCDMPDNLDEINICGSTSSAIQLRGVVSDIKIYKTVTLK